MDPKDVKPGRPSLLSAADSNVAPSANGARILADMEGGGSRKPRPPTRKSRPLWLLLGACTVAVLAGYYFLAAPGGALQDQPAVALDDSLPAGTVHSDPPAANATNAEALPEPFDSLAAHADDSTEFPLPAILDQAPKFTAAAVGTVAVAASAKSSTPKAALSRKRAGTANKSATRRDEAPLMSSLLKNIEQDDVVASATRHPVAQPLPVPPPPPAPAPAPRDHDAMDALVRQVSRGDSVAANGDIRTQSVQAALRKCPRANTRAGLRCREKVCANLQGQDRACPN